jgi:hypothetical protein
MMKISICCKPRFWKERKRMSKNPVITPEYENL